MSDQPIIFLAGGGTGGHLYPGVAVAQAMRQAFPQAKPIFLCTQRDIDRVILEPTGFAFVTQPIVPLTKSVGGLVKFWKGVRETAQQVKQLLREQRPAAVLGLGGYAAGVAVKIASQRKIPTAILNPDVIPGKANQFLMKYARAVCCQFESTTQHVSHEHRAKLQMTGCPIRAELRTLPARAEAAARLGLEPNLKTLLITGASQGAKTVNEAVLALLPKLSLQGWQILHLSGREHAEAVRAGYRTRAIAAQVVDFTPEMGDVWAVTDLAISRSGASTCAELTAIGVPSVLMPYPFHKDLHQRANALALADAGAAVLVDDERDAAKNAGKLKPILEGLLHDWPRLQAMAASAKKLGRPDAADAVARTVTQLAGASR